MKRITGFFQFCREGYQSSTVAVLRNEKIAKIKSEEKIPDVVKRDLKV